MIRTHEAGTLRASHAGERVVLAGWVARRRDHGGVVFLDLRDASGVVQVVVRDPGPGAAGGGAPASERLHDLRAEYCVKVDGVVRIRPEGNENPELPTGAVEVVAEVVDVLSEAEALPFPVVAADAPSCSECGGLMTRNGSCYKCENCGGTSGCS